MLENRDVASLRGRGKKRKWTCAFNKYMCMDMISK